jgi:hypothetical protein
MILLISIRSLQLHTESWIRNCLLMFSSSLVSFNRETNDTTKQSHLEDMSAYANDISDLIQSLLVLASPDSRGVSNLFSGGAHASAIVNDKRERYVKTMNSFVDALCVVLANLPPSKEIVAGALPSSYHELDSHINFASKNARESIPIRESVRTMRDSVVSSSVRDSAASVANRDSTMRSVKMRMEWEPTSIAPPRNSLGKMARRMSIRGNNGSTPFRNCLLQVDKEAKTLSFSVFTEVNGGKIKKVALSEFEGVATVYLDKGLVSISLRYGYLKKTNQTNQLTLGLVNGAELSIETKSQQEFTHVKQEILNSMLN